MVKHQLIGAAHGGNRTGRRRFHMRTLRVESLESRRMLSILPWMAGPPLPAAVTAAAAMDLFGTTYIFGGARGKQTLSTVYELPTGAAAWAASAPLNQASSGSGVGVPGYYGTTSDGSSEILNFGGTSGTQPTATTSWYNLEGATSYAMQTARAYFGYVTDSTASSSGGYYLYAIGGSGSNGQALASVERYDAANKDWTYLAALPQALTHTTSADDGAGHIFVFGGLDSSGQPVATVYRYTKATNSWDTVSSMPAALSGASSVYAAYGQIYVVGGKNSANQAVTTVDEYDPVLDQWTAGASLPVGLYDSAVVIDGNNQLNVIGGTSSSGPVATDYQIAVDPPPQGLPACPVLSFPATTYVDNSFVYNGQPETATAFAYASDGVTPINGTFTYTYNDSSTPPTNAGTYNVIAQFTSADPGYTNAAIAGQLTISPAYPQITVSGADTFPYDGKPHPISATAVGVDGVTPVVGSFNYTYNGSATLPTAPGTYSAVANFTSSDPNYWSWSDPQSGSGNTITVTIPDPTIPTNFTSTPVSTSQVTLSWNAAWEMDANLSSASSYEILSVHWQGHPGGAKGTDGSGAYVYGTVATAITSTSYTFTPQAGYSYAVASVNSAGTPSSPTAYISAPTAVAPNTGYYSYTIQSIGYNVGSRGVTPAAEAQTTTQYSLSFAGFPTPTIAMLSGPPTMTFDPATDTITYTPTESEVGTNPTATFQATNLAGSVTMPISFDVLERPDLSLVGGTSIYDGQMHGVTAKAYLTDGATMIQGNYSINYTSTDNPIISSTAPFSQAGSYIATVTFTNSDPNYQNYGNVTATVPVIIEKAAPTIVVNAGPFGDTGQPQAATATAYGIDGVTPIDGTFSFTYDGSPTPPSAGHIHGRCQLHRRPRAEQHDLQLRERHGHRAAGDHARQYDDRAVGHDRRRPAGHGGHQHDWPWHGHAERTE